MKNLFLFLVIAFATMQVFRSDQSFGQASTFITRNASEKFVKSATTTSATAVTVDTISVATEEAGWLEIKALGYYEDSTSSYVSTKLIRYAKIAGTLTVTAVLDSSISVSTPLSGSDFWVTKSASNNLVIKTSGKASKTVYWKLIIKQYLRRTD